MGCGQEMGYDLQKAIRSFLDFRAWRGEKPARQRFSSCCKSKLQLLIGFFLKKKPPCTSLEMPHMNWRVALQIRASALLWLLAPALLLASANPVRAQVVQAANEGTLKLSAGAIGSGDTFQQEGQRKMLGVGAFVDAETTGHFGIEAEGRWVEFHQTANVHAETYSIGGRYHLDFGPRWQPYAKGLVGFANFTYPYNYAQGNRDLIVTAGGGVDFRWTRRITLRLADVEFQDWPNFQYTSTASGNMTSLNGSVGFKVRIF